MKIVIVLAFVLILGALAAAGFFMLKNQSKGSMARALTVRIGLSVALFLFILLAYWMGWIKPTGLPLN